MSNQATVHAYTGIGISGTNITLSTSHTINEVYDYVQDYLSLNPTVTEFLTTIDGVNFTLSGNLTINNGITLSGTSSQRLNLGSNTLTLTGTGTTSGVIVTDVAGTHAPITLTGLAAGSTVYIRNTTDSTTVLKSVVAGTSTTQFITLTGDKALTIRVRKAGYIPYETTGTVGVNGYSLVVAQSADTVYTANGIDGSTVTEFSFSGSTVKIYVSDADNQTTGQRMYNWYQYTLATTTYLS